MNTAAEYSAQQIAEQLDIDVDIVREALRCGLIPAQKQNGRWKIKAEAARRIIKKNKQAVLQLKKEIEKEYWQGYTLARLQERAHEKVLERRILVNERGIAEQTIYNYLMKSKRGGALIAAC